MSVVGRQRYVFEIAEPVVRSYTILVVDMKRRETVKGRHYKAVYESRPGTEIDDWITMIANVLLEVRPSLQFRTIREAPDKAGIRRLMRLVFRDGFPCRHLLNFTTQQA